MQHTKLLGCKGFASDCKAAHSSEACRVSSSSPVWQEIVGGGEGGCSIGASLGKGEGRGSCCRRSTLLMDGENDAHEKVVGSVLPFIKYLFDFHLVLPAA